MNTSKLIKALVAQENLSDPMHFKNLGSGKKHYSKKQKDFATSRAKETGVRATARLLKLPRRTLQRWLRKKDIQVKRCPDWVYEWAYRRRKSREKWERIKYYIK
jgi:ActR/RegA family two-component response regulator